MRARCATIDPEHRAPEEGGRSAMDMTTAAARGVSDVDRSVMAPPDSVRHRAPAEGGGAAGLVGEGADAADARQSETHSPGPLPLPRGRAATPGKQGGAVWARRTGGDHRWAVGTGAAGPACAFCGGRGVVRVTAGGTGAAARPGRDGGPALRVLRCERGWGTGRRTTDAGRTRFGAGTGTRDGVRSQRRRRG